MLTFLSHLCSALSWECSHSFHHLEKPNNKLVSKVERLQSKKAERWATTSLGPVGPVNSTQRCKTRLIQRVAKCCCKERLSPISWIDFHVSEQSHIYYEPENVGMDTDTVQMGRGGWHSSVIAVSCHVAGVFAAPRSYNEGLVPVLSDHSSALN